jgi:hypothetical protein
MAILTGQLAVAGTVSLLTMPPGGGSLVLATVSGTAYVGPGSALTTSNGFPVTTAPFAVPTFTDSSATRLYATTGSTASTVSVGWLISTAA